MTIEAPTGESITKPSVERVSPARTLRTRIPDPNIWRIYATTLALGTAYGLTISVIALFLDANGYGKEAIGKLAAWFAAGVVAFSLPMGVLIRRFSAKVVLAASLLGYAVTVAALPFLGSFDTIACVRFLDGAFSVGIWVSSETILLGRAERDNKAYVTSIYAIAMAVGYVMGPLAARLCSSVLPLRAAFVLAGAIALSAAAFVFRWLDPDRTTPDAAPRATGEAGEGAAGSHAGSNLALIWRIKTSCLGAYAYGYFQASVVLFLPLFLVEEKGILREQTITIPAYFALGMLLFSNYAGKLGDNYGHLRLMRFLGAIGFTMVLGFVYLDSFAAMCVAVFVAGGSLASISPVSLALQGVIAHPRDYSRATSFYNMFYAAGMLLGPPISSYLFASRGGAVMLLHLAALWLMFVAFTVFFYRDDPRSKTRTVVPA